jgi:hypothetical protein
MKRTIKQRKMEKVAAVFAALVAKENEALVEYGLQPIREAFTKVEGNRVTFYFDGDAYSYFGSGDGYQYAERKMAEAEVAIRAIDPALIVEHGCNCSWTVYFHPN